MDRRITVEISHKTIFFCIVLFLLIFFVWFLRDLFFSLFIAFILSSAVRPPVNYLGKKGVPRIISTVFFMLTIVFLLTGLLFWVIPPVVYESTVLLKALPNLLTSMSPDLSRSLNIQSATQLLPGLPNQIMGILSSVFSNTIFVVTSLFFTSYFVLEQDLIEKLPGYIFEEKKASKILYAVKQAERRMSAWFWGQVALMTVIGVLTFVGLTILGVKYALPLALLAGLLEVIPNIGPLVSMLPTVIVGLSQSTFLGISVVALYFVIQQFENNLIVPLIMKKAVGLHPAVTLIALLIGGRIGGVLGVILAIPTALIVQTVIELFLANREK